jgi:hypothetical protein
MVKFLELRNKIIKKINDNQNDIDRMQKLLFDYDCKQIDNTLTHIKYNSYNIMKGGGKSSQLLNSLGLPLGNALDVLRDIGNFIRTDKEQIHSLTAKIHDHERNIANLHTEIQNVDVKMFQEEKKQLYKCLSSILNNIFIIYLINMNIANYTKPFIKDPLDPTDMICVFYSNISKYEELIQIYIYSINEEKDILISNISQSDNSNKFYQVLLEEI